MKRLLLMLVIAVGAVHAQDEIALSSAFGAGEGVNGEALAIAMQADGKIIIGGRFGTVNGIARNNIARLNQDGTLDRSFAEKEGVNGPVSALAIQTNGDIVVGGTFTQAGEVETLNLARYHPNGEIDKSFGGDTEPGTNGSVYALAVQPDGKIIVGGNFSAVGDQPRRGIARLNADGTLDSPVTAQNALSGAVRTVALCSDASVVAGGKFTLLNQNARSVLKVRSP